MRQLAGILHRRIPPPSKGRFAGSVFVLLLILAIATVFLPTEAASALGATAMAVGTAVAAGLIFRKLHLLPSNERRAWRLFGAGMLVISLGIWVLMGVMVITDYDAAFGPPDLLFLLGYGIGMTGLARLPHATGSNLQRIRLMLDGIIGATALAALFWVFFYHEIAAALMDAPIWDRAVGTAYPLFDLLMLITVMIVTVRRSGYRYDPRLAFIATGSIAQAVADVSFLLNGVGRSFSESSPLFPVHLIAIASFLGVAMIVDRPIEHREYADRPATPLLALVVPYGTAVIMTAVLLIRIEWSADRADDAVLLAATLAVGAMVLIRQSVAIRENRRFVEMQRSSMAASISHELRTPLTALVGYLELLNAGQLQDAEEKDEVIGIVTDQASYLARIVADLVMLAGEDHTIELDVAPLHLDELAWSSVNSAALDPAMVRVDADKHATGFVDRRRMQQAIANLLINASRYGGEQIELVAHAEGGDLLVEVHDNGPGVPRKYELLVWEKFERGPNRLNAAVPGSGIGLAVTNAIAKAHGGIAGYRRSTRLGGACFWIRLPGRITANDRDRQAGNITSIKAQAKSA